MPRPTPTLSAPALAAPTSERGSLLPVWILLAISALPDAAVAPVLRGLLVDRYGVGVGAAHAFMSVNIIGAMLGAVVIGRVRRLGSPTTMIASAALLNALLLGLMILPIGYAATMGLRFVEGAADMVVFAALFELVSRRSSPEAKGRMMGAAATFLMIGIASGMGLGGIVGAEHATNTLWMGAAACLLTAALAPSIARRTPEPTARLTPQPDATGRAENIERARAEHACIWPAMVMMFSDRVLGGVLASSVPLMLTSEALGLSTTLAGSLVGLAMLFTAIGAWPGGRMLDRLGVPFARMVGGVAYALGLAAIPFAASATTLALGAVMVVVGIGGALLFSTSLTLVARSGRGAQGMGMLHVAGNLGFLTGPLLSGALVAVLGGHQPSLTVFAMVFGVLALIHLGLNALSMAALRAPADTGAIAPERGYRTDLAA